MTAGSVAGAAAASAAAAERLRLLLLEEEVMTNYTHDDLENDWEFKIVRANTMAFRNPETLHKLIEREAQAGWIMLEKFDDSRVRFKRRRSARANDANLPPGIDPYQTYYGMSPTRYAIVTVVAVFAVVILMFGLVFFLIALAGR